MRYRPGLAARASFLPVRILASSRISFLPPSHSVAECRLAAITGRAEIMDAPGPGGLGGTFGGSPACCAAALAVLEEFADGQLLARARSLGDQFQRRAAAWQRQHAFIADVRGVGAMQAMEFVDANGAACAKAVKKLVQHCLQQRRAGVERGDL